MGGSLDDAPAPGSPTTEPAHGPPPDGWWWGRPLAETRWLLEAARLLGDPVFRGDGVPRGDGRPVVLMPGFLAGDQTLAFLALWLRRIGYRPQLCGFVGNVDCSDRALGRVEQRVESLHRRHGRRVALVGHSRGGHFARALAHRRPDLVSHAVSMGADLQSMLMVSDPIRVAVAVARRTALTTGRAHAEGCFTADCGCAFIRDFRGPFPHDRVRLTSIYTMGDGSVRWHACLVPYADCVEVTGSHTGLVFNRKAYRAIATALAAPELPDRPGGRRKP